MQAGDATFHAGWTLHSAPGNAGSTTREVMTIIYFADGTRALTPDNPNRQNDLDHWLPGRPPRRTRRQRTQPSRLHPQRLTCHKTDMAYLKPKPYLRLGLPSFALRVETDTQYRSVQQVLFLLVWQDTDIRSNA